MVVKNDGAYYFFSFLNVSDELVGLGEDLGLVFTREVVKAGIT